MPRGLMGALFGSKSWTNEAKNAAVRKKCPPVVDCPVKQTLMASAAEQRKWGVRTKSEVRQARRLAAKITEQQRHGRRTAKWPYAGSYDPTRQKGRG